MKSVNCTIIVRSVFTNYMFNNSFEKAITYPQMYSKTLNNLATTYFRLGKLKLIKLHNIIMIVFTKGRLKDAETRFLESLELNPDQPMTYNNLGMYFNITLKRLILSVIFIIASLYGESNRYRESETMFKQSISMNPNYVEAYFNLGELIQSTDHIHLNSRIILLQ